jgi:hypothetical protein
MQRETFLPAIKNVTSCASKQQQNSAIKETTKTLVGFL